LEIGDNTCTSKHNCAAHVHLRMCVVSQLSNITQKHLGNVD